MAGELTGVDILGVNEAGDETGNASMCEGRDLPWLQDTTDEDVWGTWAIEFRDVVVLDEENMLLFSYNLTDNDLQDPANYAELLEMLQDATGG
jgi:hypothetical protein